MKTVEIRNLCKQYHDFSLNNVSFALEQGHITGFVGHNGAGKSTTIKCMLNLVHPASGEILFFGKHMTENESDIKSRIGYSTGAVNYYPKRKISDILDITASFYKNWDYQTQDRYLELFGINKRKTPSELSDGMKVKLNLIIALSHRAELLILDEPTSGLDPFSRDELTELFVSLKQQGTTILFSTHIISDIEKCADDIIYIRNGKIISASPTSEFRQNFGVKNESLENTILRMERSSKI